jgi:hypothetical protein
MVLPERLVLVVPSVLEVLKELKEQMERMASTEKMV